VGLLRREVVRKLLEPILGEDSPRSLRVVRAHAVTSRGAPPCSGHCNDAEQREVKRFEDAQRLSEHALELADE
jgi:hypothetical protein